MSTVEYKRLAERVTKGYIGNRPTTLVALMVRAGLYPTQAQAAPNVHSVGARLARELRACGWTKRQTRIKEGVRMLWTPAFKEQCRILR